MTKLNEPWVVNDMAEIRDSAGSTVLCACDLFIGEPDEKRDVISPRIAACVNAFAGVTPEMLAKIIEAGGVAALLEAVSGLAAKAKDASETLLIETYEDDFHALNAAIERVTAFTG